ncbi:hypothetical protein TRVA0_023S00452 [Trichomonascus vanleenenianus]|uniref:YciI family protein n=1 Tax=Trichomonascus vanleenenianus TaxID=2268995 RepID=UPI003ECAA95F
MLSTSKVLKEYLVIVKDRPNVLEKRLEIRPEHFSNIKVTRQQQPGVFTSGGGLLSESPTEGTSPSFAGSMLTIRANSKEEVKEILKKDVYYKMGVWDVDNAEIYNFLPAFRDAKDLPEKLFFN